MKKLYGALIILGILAACGQQNCIVPDEFTGNESVYALVAGSSYDVNGTVTFKENSDGSTMVVVALSGTEGDVKHPVHLHMGSITTPGADVSALLNPVVGKTGRSETHLAQLADESTITYQQLIALDACIKVHLSDSGPEKDIVLAAGDIGKAAEDHSSHGRVNVADCKSE